MLMRQHHSNPIQKFIAGYLALSMMLLDMTQPFPVYAQKDPEQKTSQVPDTLRLSVKQQPDRSAAVFMNGQMIVPGQTDLPIRSEMTPELQCGAPQTPMPELTTACCKFARCVRKTVIEVVEGCSECLECSLETDFSKLFQKIPAPIPTQDTKCIIPKLTLPDDLKEKIAKGEIPEGTDLSSLLPSPQPQFGPGKYEIKKHPELYRNSKPVWGIAFTPAGAKEPVMFISADGEYFERITASPQNPKEKMKITGTKRKQYNDWSIGGEVLRPDSELKDSDVKLMSGSIAIEDPQCKLRWNQYEAKDGRLTTPYNDRVTEVTFGDQTVTVVNVDDLYKAKDFPAGNQIAQNIANALEDAAKKGWKKPKCFNKAALASALADLAPGGVYHVPNAKSMSLQIEEVKKPSGATETWFNVIYDLPDGTKRIDKYRFHGQKDEGCELRKYQPMLQKKGAEKLEFIPLEIHGGLSGDREIAEYKPDGTLNQWFLQETISYDRFGLFQSSTQQKLIVIPRKKLENGAWVPNGIAKTTYAGPKVPIEGTGVDLKQKVSDTPWVGTAADGTATAIHTVLDYGGRGALFAECGIGVMMMATVAGFGGYGEESRALIHDFISTASNCARGYASRDEKGNWNLEDKETVDRLVHMIASTCKEKDEKGQVIWWKCERMKYLNELAWEILAAPHLAKAYDCKRADGSIDEECVQRIRCQVEKELAEIYKDTEKLKQLWAKTLLEHPRLGVEGIKTEWKAIGEAGGINLGPVNVPGWVYSFVGVSAIDFLQAYAGALPLAGLGALGEGLGHAIKAVQTAERLGRFSKLATTGMLYALKTPLLAFHYAMLADMGVTGLESYAVLCQSIAAKDPSPEAFASTVFNLLIVSGAIKKYGNRAEFKKASQEMTDIMKQQEAASKKFAEASEKIIDASEKVKNGKLSQQEFETLSKQFEAEVEPIRKQIKQLNAKLNKVQQDVLNQLKKLEPGGTESQFFEKEAELNKVKTELDGLKGKDPAKRTGAENHRIKQLETGKAYLEEQVQQLHGEIVNRLYWESVWEKLSKSEKADRMRQLKKNEELLKAAKAPYEKALKELADAENKWAAKKLSDKVLETLRKDVENMKNNLVPVIDEILRKRQEIMTGKPAGLVQREEVEQEVKVETYPEAEAIDREIKSLQEKGRQALEEGNTEAVIEINRMIEEQNTKCLKLKPPAEETTAARGTPKTEVERPLKERLGVTDEQIEWYKAQLESQLEKYEEGGVKRKEMDSIEKQRKDLDKELFEIDEKLNQIESKYVKESGGNLKLAQEKMEQDPEWKRLDRRVREIERESDRLEELHDQLGGDFIDLKWKIGQLEQMLEGKEVQLGRKPYELSEKKEFQKNAELASKLRTILDKYQSSIREAMGDPVKIEEAIKNVVEELRQQGVGVFGLNETTQLEQNMVDNLKSKKGVKSERIEQLTKGPVKVEDVDLSTPETMLEKYLELQKQAESHSIQTGDGEQIHALLLPEIRIGEKGLSLTEALKSLQKRNPQFKSAAKNMLDLVVEAIGEEIRHVIERISEPHPEYEKFLKRNPDFKFDAEVNELFERLYGEGFSREFDEFLHLRYPGRREDAFSRWREDILSGKAQLPDSVTKEDIQRQRIPEAETKKPGETAEASPWVRIPCESPAKPLTLEEEINQYIHEKLEQVAQETKRLTEAEETAMGNRLQDAKTPEDRDVVFSKYDETMNKIQEKRKAEEAKIAELKKRMIKLSKITEEEGISGAPLESEDVIPERQAEKPDTFMRQPPAMRLGVLNRVLKRAERAKAEIEKKLGENPLPEERERLQNLLEEENLLIEGLKHEMEELYPGPIIQISDMMASREPGTPLTTSGKPAAETGPPPVPTMTPSQIYHEIIALRTVLETGMHPPNELYRIRKRLTQLEAAEMLRKMERKAPDALGGDMVPDPIAQEILNSKDVTNVENILAEIPRGSEPLAGGVEAIVLKTPDGDALRIGHAREDRPNIPEVLQAKRKVVYGARQMEWLPFASTEGITEADVTFMKTLLKERGYEFSDAGTDNLGRLPDGRLVVIDPGAIKPLKKSASPILEINRMITPREPPPGSPRGAAAGRPGEIDPFHQLYQKLKKLEQEGTPIRDSTGAVIPYDYVINQIEKMRGQAAKGEPIDFKRITRGGDLNIRGSVMDAFIKAELMKQDKWQSPTTEYSLNELIEEIKKRIGNDQLGRIPRVPMFGSNLREILESFQKDGGDVKRFAQDLDNLRRSAPRGTPKEEIERICPGFVPGSEAVKPSPAKEVSSDLQQKVHQLIDAIGPVYSETQKKTYSVQMLKEIVDKILAGEIEAHILPRQVRLPLLELLEKEMQQKAKKAELGPKEYVKEQGLPPKLSTKVNELLEVARQKGIPERLITDALITPKIDNLESYRAEITRAREMIRDPEFLRLTQEQRDALIRLRAAQVAVPEDRLRFILNVWPDHARYYLCRSVEFAKEMEQKYRDRRWVFLYADMAPLDLVVQHPKGKSNAIYLGRKNMSEAFYEGLKKKVLDEKKRLGENVDTQKGYQELENNVVNDLVRQMRQEGSEANRLAKQFLEQLKKQQLIDEQLNLKEPIVLIDGPVYQTMNLLAKAILVFANEGNRNKVAMQGFTGSLSKFNTFDYDTTHFPTAEFRFLGAHPAVVPEGKVPENAANPRFKENSPEPLLKYYILLQEIARGTCPGTDK